MLGVPVKKPTLFLGDNQSVVKSSSDPNISLDKKHVSTAFHNVRAAVFNGIIEPWWVPGTENPADCFTKPKGAAGLKNDKKVLFNSALEEKYQRAKKGDKKVDQGQIGKL